MTVEKIREFLTKNRTTLAIASAAVVVSTILTVSIVQATALPSHLITPGVTILGVDVSNMDGVQANTIITTKLTNYTVPVQTNERTVQLTPFTSSENLFVPIARFPVHEAVTEALSIGKNKNVFQNTVARLRARFFGNAVELKPTIDQDLAASWVRQTFILGPGAAEDAHYEVSNNQVIVVAEKPGQTLLVDAATQTMARRIAKLDPRLVIIEETKEIPPVTAAMLEAHRVAVNNILTKKAGLTITLKDKTTTLTAAELIELITIRPGEAGLTISPERAEKNLISWATPFLNLPENAVFTEENGRVTALTPHKDGESIDAEALATALTAALFSDEGTQTPVEIPLKTVSPEITLEMANPYGIKEMIGIGESNFRGSPRNRRHNIGVGADALDGIIIQPGETLSLIKSLGALDASGGYLPELVIKGNVTVPEYGGGLCQIGTTLFRTALNTGLVIPERRNHSYRVPYYERDGNGDYIGPGTDATIYDPSPDLKITNDTGTAVVLMTQIKGDRVTFTMWGVKDGRVAEKSDTKVYDIVPAPEPILTETADLKPGEKKCSETAHPGAKAVFTYTVTYPSGEVKTTEFRSVYRPWGMVCLVGIDPNAPPKTNPDGTPIAPTTPIGTSDAAGVSGN